MHPAEVLALALELREAVPQPADQRRYLEQPAQSEMRQAAMAGGALAALGLLLWMGRRYRVTRRNLKPGHFARSRRSFPA